MVSRSSTEGGGVNPQEFLKRPAEGGGPAEEPSVKKVREDTLDRVVQEYLDDPEKFNALAPRDRFHLAEKTVSHQRGSREALVFNRMLLASLGKWGVLVALRQKNVDLALGIIRSCQRFAPAEANEIINYICQCDWSSEMRDPKSLEGLKKIEAAFGSERLSNKLMFSYLESFSFSEETFFALFQVDEAKILNPSNRANKEYTEQIMRRRPEVVATVLKKHENSISLENWELYLSMHLDAQPSSTAHFNPYLVMRVYAPNDPRVPQLFIDFPTYHTEGLQQLIHEYPNLKTSIREFIKTHTFDNVDPAMLKDLMDAYKDDKYINIYHIVANSSKLSDFLEALSSVSFEELKEILSTKDDKGCLPLDYVEIDPLNQAQMLKLFELGNYQDFFTYNFALLDLAHKNYLLFHSYMDREPYLREHFNNPWAYLNSSNTPPVPYTVDNIFDLLINVEGETLTYIKSLGFNFDPHLQDSDGNTLYHMHPSYFDQSEAAFEQRNNFGETVLWNPCTDAVKEYLENGADPAAVSNDNSNFLHAYKLGDDEDLDIFNFVPPGTLKRLLDMRNNKGEIALINLLKDLSPTKLERSILILQNRFNITDSIPTNLYILNILLSSSSLSPHLFTLRDQLTETILNHIEDYLPYIMATPHVMQKMFLELSPDEIDACLNRIPEMQFSEEEVVKIISRLDHAISYINNLHPDELTGLAPLIATKFPQSIHKILYLTLNRPDEIIANLQYINAKQHPLIIPLLSEARLREFFLSLPLDKVREYMAYATQAQKMAVIYDLPWIPQELKDWNPTCWVGKTQIEVSGEYARLSLQLPFKGLRAAILKNLDPQTADEVAAFIDTQEQQLKHLQAALRSSFLSLPKQGATIPPEFEDPLSFDLLTDPIRLPGTPTYWLSRTTWQDYLEGQTEGEIDHPFLKVPINVQDCLPDPELAARIEEWKRQNGPVS